MITEPFVPALQPSLAFVRALVNASYQEDPEVGDEVEVEGDAGYEEATVLAIDSSGTRVRYADGREEVLDEDTWAYVRDRPRLRGLWESHLREQVPDGVAARDGLDAALKARLQAGFDVLMAGAEDFHPGSATMVRDLVHPSLYPLVREEAPEPPEAMGDAVDLWGRPYESSRYQWLPSTFAVDEAGGVTIPGPINNLDRSANAALYAALAELFGSMLPLFESVAGYAAALALYDESLEGEHELPEPSMKAADPVMATPRSLRGRELQVITKIIEYRLEDGESFEGVWHVEGMSHERILATGVCTLARDSNLVGGDLRFKRGYTQDEAGLLFWNVNQCRPKSIEDLVDEAHIPLGSIETCEDRQFVFPNCHVHKLSAMSVAGGEGTATRRVIVFWLVHPDHRITGLEDVPRPQDTMSHDEALATRLALMEERRVHKQSMNVRAVSLCEH